MTTAAAAPDDLRAVRAWLRGLQRSQGRALRLSGLFLMLDVAAAIGFAAGLALGMASLDRKSTRLNSSHANISYAVFCLKKKKNKKKILYHKKKKKKKKKQ